MAINIKKLLQMLGNKDSSVRRKAAEDLSEADERAIYPLIKALGDESAGVQDAAMRSLIAIGGETVAYMVIPLLRDTSYLRNTALIILRELGEVTVSLLYPLLKDKDADVRKFGIDLLGEIGIGVEPSAIIPFLKDENANVRAASAKALGALGYKEAIPRLVETLKDEEWVCFSALEALGALEAKEVAFDIASLLSSSSEAVRFAAIETLGRLGSDKVIDVLMAYLSDASEDEKSAVIKSLIQIGITPDMVSQRRLSDLAGHIIKMFRESDWEDKEIAIKGITALNCKESVPVMVDVAGSLDPSLPESEERLSLLRNAISAIDSEDELLKALESDVIKYRGKSVAIEMLGELRSKKAVHSLINYLHHMSRDLRRVSAEAMGEIGEAGITDYLLKTSQSDADAHVRRSAINALGNIRAKDAFTPLMELLRVEKYSDIAESIVKALIHIDMDNFLSDITHYDSRTREVIAKTITDADIILTLTKDPDKKVRIAAVYGLGREGTEKAISQLIAFLGDDDPDIRKAAVRGLGGAGQCIPEMHNVLRDPDPWVRFYAIKSIVSSCDRETAAQLISPLLNDDFIPVVMSAIDAFKEIGGQEAYEKLAAHEEHENPDVREKIREALSTL